MKKAKCLLSLLLAAAMCVGLLPAPARAAEPTVYTISNGYIEAEVSAENGGFTVGTAEGSQLKKSDNNKRLLYHNGNYDTSFLSFRVSEGAQERDYIFGGVYGGLSDPSRKGVSVSQPGGANTPITAVWGTGTLTFTVSVSLANASSNEHGMVSLSVKAENEGSEAVQVQTRILYDTCLGDQDFGFYQIADTTCRTETVLDAADTELPHNFFAADALEDVRIAAYAANGGGKTPYRIAVGHWNNLAATLFDFAPDPTLDFTDPINAYLTADSAMALYFDLGSVAPDASADLTTFYGVFSNSGVSMEERVAINVTARSRLDYNEAQDGFQIVGPGNTNLQLGVTFENYAQTGAADLKSLTLAVSSTGNLRPLESEDGTPLGGYDYETCDPLIVAYTDVAVGEAISKTLNFQARPVENASYERLTVSVYDTENSGGQLTQENLLGSKTVYVLLPAGDGSLPRVGFVDMAPKAVYSEGVRHLSVSLTNAAMLQDRSAWNLYAENSSTQERILLDGQAVTFRDDVMDVVIGSDIRLSEGTWTLKLEWTDDAVSAGIAQAAYQTQSASCLMFSVSDDPELKNECYGIAAVVRFDVPGKGTEKKPTYRLKLFDSEAALLAYQKAKWENGDPTDSKGGKVQLHSILLTFRGEFTVEEHYTAERNGASVDVPTKITAVSKKSVDPDTRKTVVQNGVSVNNCLDFENGTMSVYYYGSPKSDSQRDQDAIRVEFDGELLTSVARTTVWSGKACFTEFKQGEAISLQPYDGNERKNEGRSNDKNIALVWPAAAGIGQTLAGMVFNLAFGEMGAVYENYGKPSQSFTGYVVAFTANLDLSFAGPRSSKAKGSSYWTQFTDYWSTYHLNQTASIWGFLDNTSFRDKMLSSQGLEKFEDQRTTVNASVMVPDVMFGCGKGFCGVHFKVQVGLANFSAQLGDLEGVLEVNTIGDWSFGFAGTMDAKMFETEFRLSFKSYRDIPIPDEIYFYFGGFEPGVNIDGCGVVWITGGGGGFSNLYDTVMCVQKVPPLKLIMTLSFSILQVLDGTATLSLGGTGFSLVANDLKILKTIDAVDHIALAMEWWPGFSLKGSFSADLFYGLINGSGYVAVVGKNYADWLFEMFLRAKVQIPGDIPVVGGMTLASVDFGVNNEKIWGAADVVCTTLGITYYWGSKNVDFGVGSKTNPTFPELLGYEDVPVYYDAERDDTLYLRVGTNVKNVLTAEVGGESGMQLMGYPYAPYLRSDMGRTEHEFMTDGSGDAIVQFVYDAASPEAAQALAAGFTVTDTAGTGFGLRFYDAAANNGAGNAETANANVTWNGESGKATFAFTVTEAAQHNKVWKVSTGSTPCEAALYTLYAITRVDSVSADANSYQAGDSMAVTWTGSALEYCSRDHYRFYLTETNDPADSGIALTKQRGSSYGDDRDTLIIPEQVPAGTYYIKCVYSDEDMVNDAVFSSNTVTVLNDKTPGAVTLSELKNMGSSRIGLTAGVDGNTDGVLVNVYEYDPAKQSYTQTQTSLTFARENGSDEIAVLAGGSYTFDGSTCGMVAGKTYALGVQAYREVDSDGDGSTDALLRGREVLSQTVVLAAQTTPVFTMKTDQQPVTLTRGTAGNRYTQDVYTASALTLTFEARCSESDSSSENVTGSWSLDGAGEADPNYGTYANASEICVTLEALTEGDHTLTLECEDAEGDACTMRYLFTVDSTAPRLVVSSPLNGAATAENGTITLTALTDRDAELTVTCDGTTLLSGKAESIGSYDTLTGVLTASLKLPESDALSRRLEITAADAAGNRVSRSAAIYRGGTAGVRSVAVLADGVFHSDGVLPRQNTDTVRQLELMGVLEDGSRCSLANLPNVSWSVLTVAGSASISDAGVLTLSADAQGIVTGALEISNGASMCCTLVFGETADDCLVRIESTEGGTVIGAGRYLPGETVTVTAVPDENYVFSGWSAVGVTLQEPSALTVRFAMPEQGNVTLTAVFTRQTPDKPDEPDEPGKSDKPVRSGELVRVRIPEGVDANCYVPCCADSTGRPVPIAMSAVVDGMLVYPRQTGTVTYETKKDLFRDDDGAWGEADINFSAARGIVQGTGGDSFRPYDTLTRSAFVTILYRLSGSPAVTKAAAYSDVSADAWYRDAVSWATETGVANGSGDGTFAPLSPITREQICVMLVRWLRANDYRTKTQETGKTFADADRISVWAQEEVALCRDLGLIQGRDDGSFDPQANASRMECCAIVRRLITAVLEGME